LREILAKQESLHDETIRQREELRRHFDRLQAENASLQKKLVESSVSLSALQKQHDALVGKSEEAAQRESELQATLASLRTDIAKCKTERDSAIREQQRTQERLEESERTRRLIAEEMTSQHSLLVDAQRDLLRLRTHMNDPTALPRKTVCDSSLSVSLLP